MIRDYLRLIFFTSSLLIGIQVPAFIDQYKKRVDAHLSEAQQNLAGFQLTADKYFAGSIEELIAHYKRSQDKVFQADAQSVEQIYLRVNSLHIQWQNLQRSEVLQAYFVLTEYQPNLMDETLNQYSYTVPLSPIALGWGISLALVLTWLLELGLLLLVRLIGSHLLNRKLG